MLRTPASLRRLSLAVSSKAFDPQSGLASVGTGALLRSATVMSALQFTEDEFCRIIIALHTLLGSFLINTIWCQDAAR